MDEYGFRVCDILDAPRRDFEVILVNAVFKRSEGSRAAVG
jgi:hypothetical protein